MSIVNNLHTITEWLQAKVCEDVRLKLPSDECMDSGYEYTLVKPVVFPLYMPSKERLPPHIKAPIPSICLRIIDGEENSVAGKGRMKVMLNFIAWNPGRHLPKLEVEEGKEYFRTADGWEDVWNWLDIALREIQNADFIAGLLRVVKEDGVQYGTVSDQEGLDDFYPYWQAWITFSVEYKALRLDEVTDDEFL